MESHVKEYKNVVDHTEKELKKAKENKLNLKELARSLKEDVQRSHTEKKILQKISP